MNQKRDRYNAELYQPKGAYLPIDLFELFHVAKCDPVDNLILKPHHQGRCDYILAVFAVDPVCCTGDVVLP